MGTVSTEDPETPVTVLSRFMSAEDRFSASPAMAGGWEHVSVSPCNRKRATPPTWAEMCEIKHMFFEDEEAVVQYHPPKSEYVNNHPYCLHL